ncbi:MAG: carboxypeptidase-like regulatory domain-containing protein [Bacteroidetes bacterium]|nr:MAG: carboxypeptidase-like regulatory domain-containing protein [Bacteroidota bacterium]
MNLLKRPLLLVFWQSQNKSPIMKVISWLFLATSLVCISSFPVLAQKTTTIKGRVLDAVTEDALPYVSVHLEGTNLGTRTDIEGNFFLEVRESGLTTIQVVCVGYATQTLPIKTGELNQLTVLMEEASVGLQEITVRVERYRNRGNPAVELIKKVIEHKDENRKDGLDYYHFEKYEKVGFALNNITDKTKNSLLFRRFKFIFENADTNKVNDKISLLLFLRESLSDVYFRRSPQERKEYFHGERNVMFKDIFDLQGISYFVNSLYMDVDFYNNAVDLLTMQFTSPLSPIAPTLYRFYIQDTVQIDNTPCVHLYFAPRNKTDLAFMGHLWVAIDSTYALRKIEAGIPKDINLNWVNEMQINQEYSWVGDSSGIRGLMLTKDEIFMDFGLLRGDSTRSLLGTKVSSYRNYELNKPLPDSLFDPPLAELRDKNAESRDSSFWRRKRHFSLSRSEKGLEGTVDTLSKNRSFRRIISTTKFLFEGYTSVGGFDVGPVNTFYSFNQVEGFRMRLGGRTNYNFSERLMLEAYGAYGFRDQRWKGFGAIRYSFGEERVRLFPIHQLRLWYQNDIEIPGQALQYVNEDNFFLSFKRGVNDRMIYKQTLGLDYLHEMRAGLSYEFSVKNIRQNGAGALLFDYQDRGETRYKQDLTTTELGVRLRYAPNEKFYDGATYRTPILTRYPIFEFNYSAGVNGLMRGEYSYHNLRFRAQKAFFMSPIGWGIGVVEAGKIFGQVPYPLLMIHRANQTYAYQLNSYNLMNFLEFVSDQYVAVNYFHNFGGIFLGRIPLLKKLKWREVFSVKAIWGSVDKSNRPNDENGLLSFPKYDDGTVMTHTLEGKPYIEGSVGVANIFRVLRVDLVRRFTYTDNPQVINLAIRIRVKVEF